MRHDYRNDEGSLVRWRFVGVLEMQDLCEESLQCGMEIWSKLFFESQVRDAEITESLAKPA